MSFVNKDLLKILPLIDLGGTVAEQDTLLQVAKIETSVFSDLLADRVDLIPGTKGSGKSALYRIFVEFLPDILLQNKKVIIAHGVSSHGDPVFSIFKDKFDQLTEDDFVDFWCIYFISLAHEQFLKNEKYLQYTQGCVEEIKKFRNACDKAGIPEIKGEKTLEDILRWCLNALNIVKPKFSAKHADFEYTVSMFENKTTDMGQRPIGGNGNLPIYVSEIKNTLEKILEKTQLSMWLMVDKLDELFPRRSELERRALSGLLRTTRLFFSPQIRIKIFLREDILGNLVKTREGFTALTHVTARKADTLGWDETQILDLIIKRLLATPILKEYLRVDKDRFESSSSYRKEIFYQIFPDTIHSGANQSSTMKWIYSHTKDGNGVVTPRDIIFLITRAKQKQQDILSANPEGISSNIIESQAILYGHEELSKYKRETFLEAEFPHLWKDIKKLIGGKTQYKEITIKKIFGKNWESITSDLLSIGILSKSKGTYNIPFLYRKGLETIQGCV